VTSNFKVVSFSSETICKRQYSFDFTNLMLSRMHKTSTIFIVAHAWLLLQCTAHLPNSIACSLSLNDIVCV